jgi:YegS/Rv2252/BmrU family lipid kinase
VKMSVVAVVNPASGRGGAFDTWERVRKHLKRRAESLQTARPGDAIELTARAIKNGAGIIVAVGGDGTINEVVNGFFDDGKAISDSAVLAVVSHGTGSDLQRTLALPSDPIQAAVMIEQGASRPIDLMRVRHKQAGSSLTRYAINVTSFGLGGTVAARVTRSRKMFGGKTSFAMATFRAAMTFGGRAVRMCFDGDKTIETRITNVAVGNGRYHGGGMLACPHAEIDDGLLDVTVISHMNLAELVWGLPLLYNGRIYSHRKVQHFRVTSLTADSDEPTPLEIDGESLGLLPVEISVFPRSIRLLA